LRNLDAYYSLGSVFGTVSPGVRVAFGKGISGVANVGVMLMTGKNSSSSLNVNLEPSLGMAFGF
jgi:hypothetical protein